ncbi:MAG: hypothetical protein K8J08_06280 [Thermoanaerobaculia bacterium]|nr:hypothetical protein [Thermoanaerobaculia bacterium]
MRIDSPTLFLTLASIPMLVASPSAAQTTVLWQASSGLFPDQGTRPWTLTDTAEPEDPTLGAGALTLATDANAEILYYGQTAEHVAIPSELVIETTLQLVSGSSSSNAKGSVIVAFTLAPEFGNSLHIGVDDIFLLDDNNLRGDSAVVETDDGFHTYRIEVDSFGEVVVLYDGVVTLSSSSFVSSPANGPDPRVIWGMASTESQGVADWLSFEHNAGEPALFEDGFETGDIGAWSSSSGN